MENIGETALVLSGQTVMILHFLPLRRDPCVKTSFVAGTGNNHRVIGLGPVGSTLGSVC